jgi:DNA-binding response OmpR family regulator
MPNISFRALVVDDEVIVGKTVAHALEHEGFICELAMNGEEALIKLAAAEYDLLVTDLRMPKKHGYSLVHDLLERNAARPLVVVRTGMDNPRLTKDLMARGVDDIMFKPTNYASFAAKLKGRAVRRRLDVAGARRPTASVVPPLPPSTTLDSSSLEDRDLVVPVNERQGEDHFDLFTDFMRVSPAAIDVLMMLFTDETKAMSIAQQIAGDPTLADELIRLSNGCSQKNTARRISTVEEAVTRLGTNRICEVITDQLSFLTHLKA